MFYLNYQIMNQKGLILIPSQVDDKEVKFTLTKFIVNLDDDEQMDLDLVFINCSSLHDMANHVSVYFNEAIQRKPTDMNILTATYLVMTDILLRQYPEGFPINNDILDIIHQESEFKHIQESSGYYYQFDISEWYGVNRAVIKEMQKNR